MTFKDMERELQELRGMVGVLASILYDTNGEAVRSRIQSARKDWHKWRTERFQREVEAAEEVIAKAFRIGHENEGYYLVNKRVDDRLKVATIKPRDCKEDTPMLGKCCDCGYEGAEETTCPKREDGSHCVHWWDGE